MTEQGLRIIVFVHVVQLLSLTVMESVCGLRG